MSAQGFDRWLRAAAPGARVVYYEGRLAVACEQGDRIEALELQALRLAVQQAVEQGLGAAVQRRLPCAPGEPWRYAYEFQRNARPVPDRPRGRR